MQADLRQRLNILFCLSIVTPLGFLFKFYSGPYRGWFNHYGAGVLYEIFWILVLFLVWPRENLIFKIPLAVFVLSAILEFLQLWKPNFLVSIRSTFLGTALVGDTFSWWDFPHYALGCILGGLWLKNLACSSSS
jgi:hypothetical protein